MGYVVSRTLKSAWLPTVYVTEFEQRILYKKLSRSRDGAKFRRLISHRTYVQRMITEMKIGPSDYSDEAYQFCRYFAQQQTSPEYATKSIRILTNWGFAQSQLLVPNYNWLYLSVWLGLRSEEVENLHEQRYFRIEKQGDTQVLRVFQTKLVTIEENKAWKSIPLFLPESEKVKFKNVA